MSQTGTLQVRWDPRNLEIRTKSVEKTLEPLVTQVTTLVSDTPSKNKKGRSKKAHVLSAAVQTATENFIVKGEEIAHENPEVRQEMLSAVDDVKQTGETMRQASGEFCADPCQSSRRAAMVRAARALLSAVTRLLIIADMVDVHLLLRSLRLVEDDLERVRGATSQQGLMTAFKDFGRSVTELADMAGRRQMDLKDPRHRDDIAAARATLKKNSMMLLTTSKAYVRHPELEAAKANRDFAYGQMQEAVQSISGAAQATGASQPHPYEGAGELAAALDEFDQKIIMEPATYDERRARPSLEERLESIISGAALMADSSCTRDERRERIIAECNNVRQALQDMLSEYMNNAGHADRSDPLNQAIEHMFKKTRDLRRQLRKAVVDHVSDSFLETNVPLLVLIEAARAGNERDVDQYARIFTEHANKLIEVANLACSMSSNEDGVKMVRLAAMQLENLCPQVINAARILAARPNSKPAQENMDIFKEAWEKQVRVLTEAVDDITTIDDFLAVSESHILEDVNRCVLALQENDADTLDRTAGAIRGRSARVAQVVTAEMDNYEPGVYTENVLEAVAVLRDQVMPHFADQVEHAVGALNSGRPEDVDENEFIDASRLVYDGVRDIRHAVLMNRSRDEIDTDSEVEWERDYEPADEARSKSSFNRDTFDYEEVGDESAGPSARSLMRHLPEDEKEKIKEQISDFRQERAFFDREVSKWDASGNEIILVAKQMCMIMMEMTDFTRGAGPLRTTMDVINAAKRISELGTKLDKLARQVAEMCEESSTTRDLYAYLQRIALHCHQLNITSKVKADVQNVSGELIVSGLDSATSLITAAKNLMNAVVYTVKSTYVASTKYHAKNNPTLIRWRMKAPEKKPLVRMENPNEVHAKVRKGATKTKIEPIKALSEFE